MQIRIKGYTFNLSEPFQPGTVITKGEAQALNDLRSENIQNNTRKLVAEATATLAEGELLSQDTLAQIQSKITQYDQGYSFLEKHQPRPRVGDIEAEARQVALEIVEAAARREGITLSESELEQHVAQRATLPLVIEAARDRVAVKRRAMAGGLDALI